MGGELLCEFARLSGEKPAKEKGLFDKVVDGVKDKIQGGDYPYQ